MLEPNGKVVMISGANRGIGLATAKHLGQLGYRLSLGARNLASLDQGLLATGAIAGQWDAESESDSAAWTQATLDHFGQIDALVLNAGVMLPVGLETGEEQALDKMWSVNFKGPLRLVRAAMPALRASGHGRVVNMVSLSGKRLLSPDNLGYAASKFAALSLTHAIRLEGWSSGVRATAVCPGLVETDMTAGVAAPEGQFKLTAETIAATAAYALALPNEASVAEILVNSRAEASI